MGSRDSGVRRATACAVDVEEAQLPPHQVPDEQAHERQRDEEGDQRAPRRGERELAAHRERLRHLDREPALLDREHAPALVGSLHVAEADLHRARDAQARMRVVEARAVRGPDLDHEVERLLALQHFRELARQVGAVAQRQRELAQLVVEELVGFLARLEEDDAGRDEPSGEHARQEPHEEPVADRHHSSRARL